MFLLTFYLVTILCGIRGELLNEEQNPYIRALRKNPLAQQFAHGYIEVRPGAYLFYLFYYADGTVQKAAEKPLIIWVQGGPGFAASGIGHFAEFGPLNMDFKPRNHTWVKGRNVLLIDHPVGSGFSYAVNNSLFVKTDREMAIDLSRAIKSFYKKFKEFRKTPAYLIGQSYGGKICPRLGLYLYTAIKKKSLKMNFKGIGIGGGFVDPKESLLMQPEFLYNTGAIDRNLYIASSRISRKIKRYIDANDYKTADTLDDILFATLNQEEEINFNNVKEASPYVALEKLNNKVNDYVKPTLSEVNQSLKWEYLSLPAYHNLKSNFLVSSTSFLETLLNRTTLKIAVYNGNQDVVTPLAGASNWVHKLNWHGRANFSIAKRNKIRGLRNGYYKEMKRLSLWSVFGAGHWIPEDNPTAMEHILQYLMEDDELDEQNYV